MKGLSVNNHSCIQLHTQKITERKINHVSFCSASASPSLQVSATFAASLVTSPAIGAYLSVAYGDTLVVILATAIALLDICFILVAVPESLPEKMRPASWGAPISWEQADPFAVSNNIMIITSQSVAQCFSNQPAGECSVCLSAFLFE